MVDYARRRLFTMPWKSGRSVDAMPIRPPWSKPESEFIEACTRCHACVNACPEKIIVVGDGGFPEVQFIDSGCTFCEECAHACPSAAIDPKIAAFPWRYLATVQSECLAMQGVACQSCRDVCDARAIRFKPRLGGWPVPEVQQDLCTGCGFCVSVCPADAIEFSLPTKESRE